MVSSRCTRRPYTEGTRAAAASLPRALLLLVGVHGLASCDGGEPHATQPAGPALLSLNATSQLDTPARVPRHADPAALAELLAAVPTDRPPPTDASGGTLIGSDTGEKGQTLPYMASPKVADTPLDVGAPTFDPLLSSPALEGSARAQLYWALHKACPGPNGQPLPADVITLRFIIRADGSVEPASVSASASEARYQSVAECVLRTFSSLPFDGPLAGHGTTATLVVTWPSVD